MSRSDLQRFTEALAADSALADEFAALGDNPREWHSLARRKGYRLTTAEAGGLSVSQRPLSDHDLEEVAGGWDGDGSGGGGTTGTEDGGEG